MHTTGTPPRAMLLSLSSPPLSGVLVPRSGGLHTCTLSEGHGPLGPNPKDFVLPTWYTVLFTGHRDDLFETPRGTAHDVNNRSTRGT